MMSAFRAVLACLALLSFGVDPGHAAKPEWNQIENVKDAARRMALLQRRQGAEAALKFLEACYKTHTLAEKFTAGLESCMAQDYMLSQVLAVIYAKVPEEKRTELKVPSAEIIAESMRGRFQAIFARYKFSQQQADSLKKAVDVHGMPLFIKSVFPESGKKQPSDNGSGGQVPGAKDEESPKTKGND